MYIYIYQCEPENIHSRFDDTFFLRCHEHTVHRCGQVRGRGDRVKPENYQCKAGPSRLKPSRAKLCQVPMPRPLVTIWHAPAGQPRPSVAL